jgi:beta-mannosidase
MLRKFIILLCLLISVISKAQITEYNASSLEWRLWGYRPNVWRMNFDFHNLTGEWADVQGIPIEVPGSVQMALKNANIIEDWNIGLNSQKIEWIENRQWIVASKISDDIARHGDDEVYVFCKGLDYNGALYVNGKEIGIFNNAFIPYRFNITQSLQEHNNTIAFVFDCPPKNLAQIGWTSKISEWKPRFNYGWDWMPRIVQIGIWDDVILLKEKKEQPTLNDLHIISNCMENAGDLYLKAEIKNYQFASKICVCLIDENGKVIIDKKSDVNSSSFLYKCNNLNVKKWWPNGSGTQNLYHLKITISDKKDRALYTDEKTIGFRTIQWTKCKNSSKDADSWLCLINGKPVFLQGVDWTPIRPNFADLKFKDYEKLILTYRKLGVNIFRIWGGGFAEKDWLYDLCDKYGIMIWQDFPLSSSGLDNYPPDNDKAIEGMSRIVNYYVKRLRHHPSIILWCGGNELYKRGDTAPITEEHPMISAIKEITTKLDPDRRFVPGTPSGPTIMASLKNFGKKICYDVHGPWDLPDINGDKSTESIDKFWRADDALFHSEVGTPGAMSIDMMNKYKGNFELLPASLENPLWRNVCWWSQWNEYKLSEHYVYDINMYIKWSQQRQTEGLVNALKINKERFPACGGFIIWMGHDSFPCMINTSIIDFDGNLKPAAYELSKIWKSK